MGETGSAGAGAVAAGCPGGVGAVAGQKFGWRESGEVALGNETGSHEAVSFPQLRASDYGTRP